MERLELYPMPGSMIVPYTYSFPLIRRAGLPREFRGIETRHSLTESIYMDCFEYSYPLTR